MITDDSPDNVIDYDFSIERMLARILTFAANIADDDHSGSIWFESDAVRRAIRDIEQSERIEKESGDEASDESREGEEAARADGAKI